MDAPKEYASVSSKSGEWKLDPGEYVVTEGKVIRIDSVSDAYESASKRLEEALRNALK